eukprot:TRINITY_DN4155_c0_g1_i2.p1 TRINITY_DN4155_c0_g1~~TRINITY_DN4155_c0_g1_i2.p1  ORF type:complete len:506 (-),score=129.38 TRINITY_DN4155_c0_g1_i2:28-1545(-)
MFSRCVSVVALVWCITRARAWDATADFVMRGATYDFADFGFLPGGTATLYFTTDPPLSSLNLTLFICQEREFQIVWTSAQQNGDGGRSKLCSSNSNVCEVSGAPVRGGSMQYTVTAQSQYHLLLTMCDISLETVPPSISIRSLLVNPGGQQLAVGTIPLPKVYEAFVCIWSFVILLCIIFCIKERRFLSSIHALLAAIALTKYVVVILTLLYWRLLEVSGQPVLALHTLQSVLYAASEAGLFCCLLLVSRGWRITRSALPPTEVRTMAVAITLLLATLLFFSFYNSTYYFLVQLILYFFMMPKIFTSITRNTRALHAQILLIRPANHATTAPLHAKIRMFKILRTAVILYLGSLLLVSSMKIIMAWFLVWINYCASESASLIMFVLIVCLLRPGPAGVISDRAFFATTHFLNMQNTGHFDEILDSQNWDPERMVRSGLLDTTPDIDIKTILVIEYPASDARRGEGRIPLAIAIKDKTEAMDHPTSPTTAVRARTPSHDTSTPALV